MGQDDGAERFSPPAPVGLTNLTTKPAEAGCSLVGFGEFVRMILNAWS